MKRLFNGFIMSLTMFSIVPMTTIWDDKAFSLVMPFLPIVGAIIGSLWYILSILLIKTNLHIMLSSVFILLLPLFMSGFIHVDGYMDTTDAISSRAELQKKQAILKDSNVGAFAVIAICCYLIIGFATVYTLIDYNKNMLAFLFIPVISRSVAGISLLTIKPMHETGFGATFKKDTKQVHIVALFIIAITSFVIAYMVGGINILLVLLILVIVGVLSSIYTTRQLNGISGDLCGFIITVSELSSLLALAVV